MTMPDVLIVLNNVKYKLKIQSSESKTKQSNKQQFICFCLMILGISGCVVGGTANLYPKSNNVILKDIPAELIAVKEFSGICTEGEISKQRALLEDLLLSDGILYDNLSFRVLQYNPPYTLPWLRRNEVSLKIDMDINQIRGINDQQETIPHETDIVTEIIPEIIPESNQLE
jgi:hypothetical protein